MEAALKKIDEHCNIHKDGNVSFEKFWEFVQQKDNQKGISVEEIMRQVARAVRLALRRNNIQVKDLDALFQKYDDLSPQGELGPPEMRRFFRNVLKVTKH